jgi:two-component system response regulator AtoC
MSDSEAAPGARAGDEPSTPSKRYQLMAFWEDEVRTFELPAEGPVSIGRAEENAVRIDEASVSRQHAVLHVGPELVIEDLGGSNGTWIRERAPLTPTAATANMRQVARKKARIKVGEGVLLGAVSFVVRHAVDPELPELPEPSSQSSAEVVTDPAMRALYAQAALAAKSNISVLLLGETGVGKEVLARAIHARSGRAAGPFLGINCAAIAESILESELFGFEKGAFTGALQARAGLFESAEGGTVFLDELGELPLSTQAKLLRVLEERAVMRLGSNRLRPIDVRFLGATNRDLEAEAEAGRFRLDLFYRLNGISLLIPPLRERPADLDPLIRRFVLASCREVERSPVLAVSTPARELLHAYAWPGNVRELRNVIQRAVVLCPEDTILPAHLPHALTKPALVATAPSSPPPRPPTVDFELGKQRAEQELKSVERDRVVDALKRAAGNQTEAARLLGVSRRTLVSRLGQFGLPRPRKRD